MSAPPDSGLENVGTLLKNCREKPFVTGEKIKVLLVFAHRREGAVAWPRADFDYDGRKNEVLRSLKEACPNMIFDVMVVCSAQDASAVIERSKEKEYDGIVLYLLGSGCPAPLLILEKTEKPTVLVDEQYCGSGTFALAYSWSKMRGIPFTGIASSNFNDITSRIKLISVVKRLRSSKIILVTPKGEKGYVVDERRMLLYGSERFGSSGKTYDVDAQIRRIKELFGSDVIKLGYADVKRYLDAVSDDEARRVADMWIKSALRVVEPSYDEIVKSAKLYLGLREMICEYGADAITMDCYEEPNELPAYPCMAFFQLNNEGVTAVCEADLSSTVTQLMLRYLSEELTGEPRPGFVSNLVADFSKGQIIYCHCTAPAKVFGPRGPLNPYIVRSRAESRKGAAIQSLMPSGEPITAVQIHFMRDPPVMVIHQGKSVHNVDSEEGCRTKLAAEADAEKIFSNLNRPGGWIAPAHWHRVVIFGSWRRHLIELASLLRLEVFEEDKVP